MNFIGEPRDMPLPKGGVVRGNGGGSGLHRFWQGNQNFSCFKMLLT